MKKHAFNLLFTDKKLTLILFNFYYIISELHLLSSLINLYSGYALNVRKITRILSHSTPIICEDSFNCGHNIANI